MKNKKYIVIVMILFWFLPLMRASAADFAFSPSGTTIAVGRPFSLAVNIKTDGQVLNAVGGEIFFPNDLLDVNVINDGDSMINFWIEAPRREGNRIIFSGIVPGGYYGDAAELFTVIFVPKKDGSGEVAFGQMSALLNDGAGTAAPVVAASWPFAVAVAAPGGTSIEPPVELPVDTDLPEVFTPSVSSSPELFDGAYFLVFKTQDKGSGLDYYEVSESREKKTSPGAWQRAETPYRLKDQALMSWIRVRAVDKAGNVRVAEMAPINPPAWYETIQGWGIIIFLALAMFLIVLLWRKAFGQKK